MGAHGRSALHGVGAPDDAPRRRAAVLAGYSGDATTALTYLEDDDPATRAAALGALVRLGVVDAGVTTRALADPSALVRCRAAELAASLEDPDFLPLLSDEDAGVVEAACFAVGELRDAKAVATLCRIAAEHTDALCRESAVAALGSIGDPAGLPAILQALEDRPAVRRRAVIALAPFEGEDVTAALEKALTDRDWQVRQAAEDQLRP